MAEQSRLDYLEGRVEEQSRNWDRLFNRIDEVDQKVDRLGVALSARVDLRCDLLDTKITDLRGELATQFRWTIGIMVTLLTGVLAAILTR